MCVISNSSLVSFFCMWFSNFTNTTYWRSFPFFIVYFWLLCQKLVSHIHMGLFLGSQFCSTGLCVSFLPIPYCFDYCSFVVYNLKSGSVIPLFPPPPKITLAIQGLLWYHTNLIDFLFYFYEKCLWDFDGNCIKSVYCFRYMVIF